jgi:hypothetical protein
MDRRGFLATTLATAGGVAVAPSTAEAAAAAPHRRRPLAIWEELGGFVPAGYLALRPPRLVLYGDGLVVADASRQLRLRQGPLDEFVDFAAEVLSNRANGVLRPGAPIVTDVPTTRFSVRRGGRTWSLAAEALEVLREHRGYPRPLYDLLDRFAARRDQVLRTGDAFTPPALRLVTLRIEKPPATPVPPWPAGVPAPMPRPGTVSRQVELYGAAARAAVRGIPHPDAWTFTTFRTRSGVFLSAAWRRLLPHEQYRD